MSCSSTHPQEKTSPSANPQGVLEGDICVIIMQYEEAVPSDPLTRIATKNTQLEGTNILGFLTGFKTLESHFFSRQDKYTSKRIEDILVSASSVLFRLFTHIVTHNSSKHELRYFVTNPPPVQMLVRVHPEHIPPNIKHAQSNSERIYYLLAN